MTFRQSPVVPGPNPYSRSTADFSSEPWDTVRSEPEIRAGRTDTKLDPKGRLTLALMEDSKSYDKGRGSAQGILCAPENSVQVLQEERADGWLRPGPLDARIFYSAATPDGTISVIAMRAAMAPKAIHAIRIVRDAPDAGSAEKSTAIARGAEGQKKLSFNCRSSSRQANPHRPRRCRRLCRGRGGRASSA
jgi:molybdate/tungstate transport system substrate-binding protein